MRKIYTKLNTEDNLIQRFNSRSDEAFAEVYASLFNELCYFANKIFAQTEYDGCDVVHDIFLSIWTRKELRFESIVNIKAYIYTSIKNGFRDYLSKHKNADKYRKNILMDDRFFISQMLESESLTLIQSAIKILPDDCAKILKLYLDGWDMKDIVEEMKISQSAVYAKKQTAIDILRKKLPHIYTLIFC